MLVHLMHSDFLDTATGQIITVAANVAAPAQAYTVPPPVVPPVEKTERKNKAKTGRTSKKVKAWRLAILNRDKYTCQACGAVSDLQVHHHARFANIDISAHDFLFNGVTLCVNCHCNEHPELSEGGKRGLRKFATNR